MGPFVVALGLIIAAQFLPNQNNVCTILADALMAVVLFAFLGMRFGVLRSLSARQAVLTWQRSLAVFCSVCILLSTPDFWL